MGAGSAKLTMRIAARYGLSLSAFVTAFVTFAQFVVTAVLVLDDGLYWAVTTARYRMEETWKSLHKKDAALWQTIPSWLCQAVAGVITRSQ